ncbi:green-sensitive opsin P521-like [Hydractinia symbiolongicarpus]|uniref:green-sensitive opsin P521-like n=1 Tax=Hydractinia symbiolongicarpus TaxID=13093 RepID=UPI00254A98D7|nr:green-sensitive opsin P521-like [Hydractinia symbiolongicarpus]
MDHTTFIAFLSIIVVLTLTFNGLAIFGLLKQRRYLSTYDITLLFLMFIEFLQAIIGYPIELFTKFKDGGFLCNIAGYSTTSLALVSILLLVALALMRVISVMYPFKSRLLLNSKKSSLYFIVPSTLYGFAWGTFPLLGWSKYSPELNSDRTCSVDLISRNKNTLSYLYALMIACYFIPLTVIFLTALGIGKKLWGRTMSLAAEQEQVKVARARTEKRMALFLFLVIAAFVIAWTPYALMIFLISLGGNVTTTWLDFSALLAKSSTFYNPVIYIFMHKRSRVAVFKFLGSITETNNNTIDSGLPNPYRKRCDTNVTVVSFSQHILTDRHEYVR